MMLESSQILIQGQIDVLKDIGSLGILNRNRGAANIKNESWLTAEAREGFRLQEQAENALKIRQLQQLYGFTNSRCDSVWRTRTNLYFTTHVGPTDDAAICRFG